MGILGQILKLTAISIFFSATATIYIVDSDIYKNFLNNLNSERPADVSAETDKRSKEELKNYREYLRRTEQLDKPGSEKSPKDSSKTKSIWQNSYNN